MCGFTESRCESGSIGGNIVSHSFDIHVVSHSLIHVHFAWEKNLFHSFQESLDN